MKVFISFMLTEIDMKDTNRKKLLYGLHRKYSH